MSMRVNQSLRNIFVALIGQGLSVLISLIARIVFVHTLGIAYVGVDGLFTNVLSVLSLAELGVGGAIIYSLYKPLAIQDEEKIGALMNFYKRAYQVIGTITFLLGISLMPFFTYMIKESSTVPSLNVVYILFLINTCSSYFLGYKRNLLIADQKKYISTIYRYVFYILMTFIQMIILVWTKNFVIYLSVQTVCTVLENVAVSYKVDKLYSFLKQNKIRRLDKYEKDEIIKNVKAMMCHRVGGVIVNGTDNILISTFVGLTYVGMYSNYYLIIHALNSIIGQLFECVTASVGNLSAVEDRYKAYDMYKKILLVNFWIVGLCSIGLGLLINPFITLWIGKAYVLKEEIVGVLIVSFYLRNIRATTLMYRDALGLFWYDRYKPIVEAVLNLIVSILLAIKFGLIGIVIGTVISTLTISFWIEPYILYKYGFHTSVKDYFIKVMRYSAVVVIAGYITFMISTFFIGSTWYHLVLKGAVCIFVPNIIFIGFFRHTPEFKYFWELVCKKWKRY